MLTNRDRLILDGKDPTTMNSQEIVEAYADPILDCGHPPTEHPHKSLTPGYGTDVAGRILCWDCCAARTIADMRDASEFMAYLSVRPKITGNSRDAANKAPIGYMLDSYVYHVTTWTGHEIAKITHISKTWAGFRGGTSDGRWYFQAIDTNGKRWICNSPGPGKYCRMRAARPRKGDVARILLADGTELQGEILACLGDRFKFRDKYQNITYPVREVVRTGR